MYILLFTKKEFFALQVRQLFSWHDTICVLNKVFCASFVGVLSVTFHDFYFHVATKQHYN